ncbi:PaaI family thioesterase [Bradyrhizobium lablabi]|uniref:PaaI family thioesterase n=1 Tax=Bradyrhizobium lablabi TaxID=722472 RepID=UPI001BACDB3E|nr:PaaI family thioesterase [Bradyrhizobium lablabi]MBR1122253.1 PaaI family thioesterase [Bradyrhizobium lablabi]
MTAIANATRLESPDLFAPELRRQRMVEWQTPGPVALRAMGMSGLEAMQGIRDGVLPPPPFAKLIGFRMAVAEPGRIVMELDAEESLENTIGLLHGATAAALLDTAMGCAISTMLPVGQNSVTLDLKLTYLRPLSAKSGTIQAEGKIIKLGRQTSYTEGFVRNGKGDLAVHATATFSMIGEAAKPK